MDSVAEALIKVYERGVEVKVVFEAEQAANYPIYKRLKDAGVEVRNDTNPSFMHNKVAIIDGEIVLTGSYNWTNSAEHANNENLVVIKDRAIAKKFDEEFWKIWSQG